MVVKYHRDVKMRWVWQRKRIRVIEMAFAVAGRGGSPLVLRLTDLVIAGWAGRDRDEVERHIAELEKMGVKRPARVPIFYRVDVGLLTQREKIQVVGTQSSGEAEAVMLFANGERLVAVGSDHTDREAEAAGITLSKQMCAKPLSRTLWAWADVCKRWEEFELRSVLADGTLYQRGSTRHLLHPDDLVARYEAAHGPIRDGTVMFCGTSPAIGGIRPSSSLSLELVHEPSGERLAHRYTIETLPIAESLG
jgi:hypothetical protein